ncbi:hypothetical protein LIER_39310 [Lithospermum erythrorhizon]|uniref:Uncharacterized protein n=1 Tax=Lithospermum erythrorhizon TaxID=34254 RepID=A0AAV3QF56_LITER
MTLQFQARGCSEALGEVACILWNLWKHINSIQFECISGDMDRIWKEGLELAADYIHLNTSNLIRGAGAQSEITASNNGDMWTRPRCGYVKVNCDAAWNKQWKDAEAQAVMQGLIFSTKRVINGQLQTPLEIDTVVADIHHLAKYLKVKF